MNYSTKTLHPTVVLLQINYSSLFYKISGLLINIFQEKHKEQMIQGIRNKEGIKHCIAVTVE